MTFQRSVLPTLVAVALAASCSQLPQSSRTDDQMTSIREEYLQNHPDGVYNAYIREGRVVKGMGVVEVLASWGLPNARRQAPEGEVEYWAYYARDEQSKQLLNYELIFESKVLNRWSVRTDVPMSLGTTDTRPESWRTVEETLRLGNASTSGSSEPQKQKP
jgi:hypothetical protein